jgi:hypothetical protein
MRLHRDTPRSILFRRQPTEPVTYVGEGGGGPRNQPLPSGRALAGFLDPNTVTHAIEDLGRSGYRPLHPRPKPREPSSIQAGTNVTLHARQT